MSNHATQANHGSLHEHEARALREFVTAVVLNGQVTAEAAGLYATDLYVLNLLDLDAAASPGELARRTALTNGAITKLLDRLERMDLVRREPDPADRRKVRLTVIDSGANEAIGSQADVFGPMSQRMDELIQSYPPEQRATIFDFFSHATSTLRTATSELQENRNRSRQE
ncbi:MarR family winged helix-turn-helix transcriptional regulator [Salinifilum ghardaiensis]